MNKWFLQHGWGFDNNFWSTWQQYVPSHFTLKAQNRGYFLPPLPAKPDNYDVLVAHSYGLHLLENFHNAKLLVILAGFQSFRSPEIIEKMKIQLTRDSQKTLSDFYNLCFYPTINHWQIPTVSFHSKLYDDLFHLQYHDLNIERLRNIPNILIFHGDQDKVVPLQWGLDLHHQLPQSQLCVIPGAGHALPITHAKICCATILNECLL